MAIDTIWVFSQAANGAPTTGTLELLTKARALGASEIAAFHVGDATFMLKGKSVTLPFYADDRNNIASMSAFFIDGLTGTETYGSGRYVDVGSFGAFPPKTVTIDFNEAYNPNCARSPFFTCPVATDVIALAIRAGEKDPHRAH